MNHNIFYFDNGSLFFNGNETELIETGLIDEQFDVEEKFPVFYGMRVGKYVVHWHASMLIHSDFCRLFCRESELITGERPDQYQIESTLQFASRKHVRFDPSSIMIDRHVTPTKKEQRRHRVKTKSERPLFDFYELEIDPNKSRITNDSARFAPATVAGHRNDPRVHAVRGHFKYYSEERPLFGRVVGAVWCPGHMRGNTESGEIIKTYKVKS